MRTTIATLVVAAAIGGMVGVSYAQENPKAAGPPPAGAHKEMPAANSAAAKTAEAPGTSSGPAKVGQEAAVKPGTTIHSKSVKR
jgi:hypothetical protein